MVQLDLFFLQGIPVLSKQQKNSVTKIYDKFELNESQTFVKTDKIPLKTYATKNLVYSCKTCSVHTVNGIMAVILLSDVSNEH